MIDGAADTLRDTDGFGRQAICELRCRGEAEEAESELRQNSQLLFETLYLFHWRSRNPLLNILYCLLGL